MEILMKLSENWRQSPHLSEVKLVYQTKGDLDSNPILCAPEDVYTYLTDIWDLDRIELQEEFCVILLNNSLRVLGWHLLSKGGKNATVVEASHVLVLASLANASSVILAHNHLSSINLKASRADIHLTNRISEALNHVGIKVNDHVIISRKEFYSFRNHGLL